VHGPAAGDAMHGDVGRDMGDDAADGGLPQSSAMWSAPSRRRSLSSHLGSCNVRMSNDCAYVGVNIRAPGHTGDVSSASPPPTVCVAMSNAPLPAL